MHADGPDLPADVTTQAAVDELLGGFSPYSDESSLVEPYDPERLSVPLDGSSPTLLVDVLPDEARECLVGFGEKMLRPASELGES